MADRSLRAEQVEETRLAIIAAARRLFGSRGYAATSVDDIAAAARVTKGAVYHHFATKQDVFRAVYSAVEADAQARPVETASLPASASALDLIVAGMQSYLDAALDPEVQRVTLIDGPAVLGPAPEGAPEEQPRHVALRAFIASAIDRGEIAPLDPDALTHLISGSCLQAGIVIAASSDHGTTRRRIGEALEAMIRGLAPPTP